MDSKYDLICLDWKLPGLSGLALFNRLRTNKSYASTPIMVISGFLQKADFKILSEYSCSALLEKPFARPQFETYFNKLLDLKRWRDEAVTSIREVMADFDKDPKKAMKRLREVIEKSPEPMQQVVNAARAMRAKGLYEDAEAVLRQALEKDPKAVGALTELGKVLHLMKRHRDAARALQAANFISSDNMERLLLLGEVRLHNLEPLAARKHFEDALGIDPGNAKAKAGVLSAENMEAFSGDPSLKNVPQSFASLLNIIAISKVRSGKLNEGVAQYKAALNFLHENQTIARVFFNLGLAYLREQQIDQAKQWFAKSAEKGGTLFDKAGHYVRKLEEHTISQSNTLSYAKGGPSTNATGSATEDCSTEEQKDGANNVEYMEETDFIEGDLNIAVAAGDSDADAMEDAVSYI
jgi:tetratricopeptide (TPR) repeat protein